MDLVEQSFEVKKYVSAGEGEGRRRRSGSSELASSESSRAVLCFVDAEGLMDVEEGDLYDMPTERDG